MSLYIFLLYYIYHLCFTCIAFYDLSAWGGCWFFVFIRRFIYQFLNVCPFDYMVVAGSGKVGPVNHTSWVAVVTPTDRPKSVRSRCVIELFGPCLCCHFALMTFLLVYGLLSQDWVRYLPFSLVYYSFPKSNFCAFYVFFNLACFLAILCSIMQWSTKSVCILCKLHVNRLSNVFKFERLKNFQDLGGGGGFAHMHVHAWEHIFSLFSRTA